MNHLGHFLLTQLLLERLRASAPARIVTVASRAHTRTSGIDWDALRQPTRTRTGIHEYAVSKLANVWFSAELGRRLAGSGVHTYALHPGVVASDVWRSVPWPRCCSVPGSCAAWPVGKVGPGVRPSRACGTTTATSAGARR